VLVTVKGLGSIWEHWTGRNGDDPRRFARAAFYNTTGVPMNGKLRYRWHTGGKIRFNTVGGFNPNHPLRSLNRVFECKEPEITAGGWTLVLFKRMLNRPARPDFYLFVVTSDQTGGIDCGLASIADGVRYIAVSEHDRQQEAMLLMPAYSWVRGGLGTFYVEPSSKQFWSAELRLERAGLPA
jgi:hypothetical protein